jgi:SAM-dependent methyltransferase
MTELALPLSDEPFDFRHQAHRYARYRRDYSAALYDAIASRTGAAAGRVAIDLGCGTGFVTRALRARGWRAAGVDFSAPMLAAAHAVEATLPVARGRGEALPFGGAAAALLTCGTAFHWLAPAPTLAEMGRVVAPGGWVALFWRYAHAGEPYWRLVTELLGRFGGPTLTDALQFVHPPEPFAGSLFSTAPPLVIDARLDYTVESFHGYVSTVEVVRRAAGARHEEFLAALRVELERRWPAGFSERNQEYLFLGQRSAARASR